MRFALTLMTICVAAASVLGLTYVKTRPLILLRIEQEKRQALEYVFPRADAFREKQKDGLEYYTAYKAGELLGCVARAKAKGYSGTIDMMVGIDTDGLITGVSVIDQQETPGLGANLAQVKRGEEGPWFLRQFKQKSAKDITLEDIDAITGATITTRAVIKGITDSAAAVIGLEQD